MLNARTFALEHILNHLQWRVSGNWPNRHSVLLSFHFDSWNHWLCRYFNIDCSPSIQNFYELCVSKKEKLLLVTGFHRHDSWDNFVTNCGWKYTILKDPNIKHQWLIWPDIYLITDWYLLFALLGAMTQATDHYTCQVVTGPGHLGSWLWWRLLLASSLHDVGMSKFSRKPLNRMLRRGPRAVSSIPVAVSIIVSERSDQWCHENLIRVSTGPR